MASRSGADGARAAARERRPDCSGLRPAGASADERRRRASPTARSKACSARWTSAPAITAARSCRRRPIWSICCMFIDREPRPKSTEATLPTRSGTRKTGRCSSARPGHPAPAADLREHEHGAAVHRRGQRDARVLRRQRRRRNSRSRTTPVTTPTARRREDLLASPQFVMDAAYTTLRGERFPAAAAVPPAAREPSPLLRQVRGAAVRWRWSACARATISSAAPTPTAGATS